MANDSGDKTQGEPTDQALEGVRHLNKLILESAGEGVYGLDTDGKTTFVNPAAERMTGYTAKEMIGHCQHKLVHHTKPDGTAYIDKECPIYSAVKDGKIHTISNEVFWRKDGTPFPVEYVSTPIWENLKLRGAVVVFKDISERKQAEEEIQCLRRQLELENAYLNEEVLEAKAYGEIVGSSPALEGILRQIDMVGPTDASVLITGESGTGKELVARLIHTRSQRAFGTIVAVNCGALSDSLLESELFGHEKGAFTGATSRRKGKIELADGGTLFLDEIGEVSTKVQVELLRALDDKKITRLGGTQEIPVNFRLICATNRDLEKAVRDGDFRDDLFFRINVFALTIPPLRDRPEDILPIAEHFLERYAGAMGRQARGFSTEVQALLVRYPWPGNVRELANAIERALVVCRGTEIEREHLPIVAAGEVAADSDQSLSALEEKHIRRMLKQHGFNVTHAAKALGIDRVTLYNKMRKFGIERE